MRALATAIVLCAALPALAAPPKLLGNFSSSSAAPGSVTLHTGPLQHEYRVSLDKSSPHTDAYLTFGFGHDRGVRSVIASDVSLTAKLKPVGNLKIASFHVPAGFIEANRDKVYKTTPELTLALNGGGYQSFKIASAQ